MKQICIRMNYNLNIGGIMNVYQENGYENRKEYLKSLAEDFAISPRIVFNLASLLGEEEDFDGLVTSLEDHASDFEEG